MTTSSGLRWYYIIRVNWILFAIIFFYFVAGASSLGLPWPVLPFEVPVARPFIQTALAFSALTLLLICWVRRDTIFRPMKIIGRQGDVSQTPTSMRHQAIDLRITGRFDRGLGHAFTLRECPVQWKIDDTGSISLEAYLERVGGTGVFSLMQPDNTGLWSFIVPRETLTDGTEEGVLYSGLTARPAFRLALPARRMTAILSVESAARLMELRRMFDEVLAESAAKQAEFFRAELGGRASQPAPAVPSERNGQREEPAGEIPWKDLIKL